MRALSIAALQTAPVFRDPEATLERLAARAAGGRDVVPGAGLLVLGAGFPQTAMVAAGLAAVVVGAAAANAFLEDTYLPEHNRRFAVAPAFPGLGLELVATDADPHLLARARRGCYGATALKELPPAWRARAFRRSRALYCLKAPYREGIAFRRQDLRRARPRGRPRRDHRPPGQRQRQLAAHLGRRRRTLHRLRRWAGLRADGRAEAQSRPRARSRPPPAPAARPARRGRR